MRRWLAVAALGAAFLTVPAWGQRRGGASSGGFAGHAGFSGGHSMVGGRPMMRSPSFAGVQRGGVHIVNGFIRDPRHFSSTIITTSSVRGPTPDITGIRTTAIPGITGTILIPPILTRATRPTIIRLLMPTTVESRRRLIAWRMKSTACAPSERYGNPKRRARRRPGRSQSRN